MKEFVKIFVVLVLVASSFFIGRSFGTEAIQESTEIKTLKSDNFQCQNAQSELSNLKLKMQTILDTTDLKKTDDLLGQVIPVFVADLSLQITEEKQNDLQEGKSRCSLLGAIYRNNAPPEQAIEIKPEPAVSTEIKKDRRSTLESIQVRHPLKNEKKFKSDEITLIQSKDAGEIKKNLEKLELKRIDSLLDGALKTTFEQSRKFFGSYRGTIYDVDNKVYGTLIMQMYATVESSSPIKGNIKVFREGVERIASDLNKASIGFSPEDYAATLITLSEGDLFLQIYKMNDVAKIAGFLYERLPNGTTKTIGSYVLSRTDFED